MNSPSGRQFDRVNAFVALGVLGVTLIVYTLTKAPTLSFWDCGEFIAASYILGIPHPPGYPLYTLLGRVFSIIPLFTDIATRVNFLSSLSNAFTALFGYLAAVRILRLWFGNDRSAYTRFLVYAGSASGAFFLAFGLTQWNNSVEAEVYGLTMLLFMAILWLGLIYYEHRGTLTANRILVLIVYLATLGIGVHLTVFMIFPVIGLLFILRKDIPIRYWYLVGVFFAWELYLIFALSSRPGEVHYYVPVAIVAVFYAFYLFSFEKIPGRGLVVGAGFLMAIAPLYYVLYRVIVRTGVSGSESAVIPSVYFWIGGIASVALVGYAIAALYSYLRMQPSERQEHLQLAVPSLFVLMAALMSLIVVVQFRGYTTFLIITAASILVLAVFLWRYVQWPMLVAVLGVSMVIIGVREFAWGLLAAFVIVAILGLKFKMPGWGTSLMVILAAVAGFSINTYMPVRSSQQPIINQTNTSEGLTTTINFIERKQYGAEPMVDRMFVRRGEWANQFGDYRRMGFWRFLDEQYGLTGSKFFILLMLGLFGVWEVIRRKPSVGSILLILLLVTSVGLVLYMNFADGTRQTANGLDYLEVRDRDYFFTPFFVLFGMVIGMGISLLVQFIREAIVEFAPVARKVILACIPVLFLLPIYALAGNYYECNRSRNHMPYEYARNILISCPENAILFTGGDNDTFPLWCAQEVYKLRTDVKVVCLPLANTQWYIRQLRDNMGLNVGMTDQQIEELTPYRLRNGPAFRIQDQVVNALIDNNSAIRPVCFSITVGAGSRLYNGNSADSMLQQHGMVLEWQGKKGEPAINVDGSIALFIDPDSMTYTGFADPHIYKDEAAIRQAHNLSNAMLLVVNQLRRDGDTSRAIDLARFTVNNLPQSADAVNYLASLLLIDGRMQEVEALADSTKVADPVHLKVLLAREYRKRDDPGRAEIILKGLLLGHPHSQEAFGELLKLYVAAGQYRSVEELLVQWLAANPGDQRVAGMLQQLRQQVLPDDQTRDSQ